MKQYVKPEIRVSMFDTESVTTNNVATVLSQPVYGNNLNTFIQNNQSKAVQRNLDFNDAIQFN